MNCFNHTQEPAVAQCSDCGKGLCPECAARYQPILCSPCYKKRKDRAIWDNLYYLILYTAFFVIGYKLDFMTTKRMPDMQWMSGYVLMAFWAGYVFINKVLPWKMTAGTTGQWNFYYVFKFLLYLVGGFFVAPFVVFWTVYKFIRALRR